jgi:putative copper export protein
MTETPLNEVFSILPAFLTKTKYGKFTILKSLVMFFIIAISFLSLFADKKYLNITGAIASLLLLIVISMSGHQGAEGYTTFPFFLDVFHTISISLWIGGIFFLSRCFSFFLKEAGIEFMEIFKRLINRFSLVATFCVFIAGVTGIILSFVNVKSLSILIDTQYGVVLLLKAILVGMIVILGGINKFIIIPRLNKADKDEWSALIKTRKKLYITINAEMCIGSAVLLLTSLLTHLSPEG